MPQPRRKPSASKPRIPRSRCFTGCFTCRARGVKCDETKPVCRRCRNGRRFCEGYGVRLIWEENRQSNAIRGKTGVLRSERRILHYQPKTVLSDKEVDLVLKVLDTNRPGPDMSIGLFSVFQPSASSSHIAQTHPLNDDLPTSPSPSGCDPASTESQNTTGRTRAGKDGENDGDDIYQHTLDKQQQQLAVSVSKNTYLFGLAAGADVRSIVLETLPPQLGRSIPSPSTSGEMLLLQYWNTCVSRLLIATEQPDNPFQTIYIPLALSALENRGQSSGHAALLHSIYALAAFTLAQRESIAGNIDYSLVGVKHHELSLHHLQRSLHESAKHCQHREAVLAAIILLITIDVVVGQYSGWRTHLLGGQMWLLSTGREIWEKSHSSSILYQMFLCLKTIGSTVGTTSGGGGGGGGGGGHVPWTPNMLRFDTDYSYTSVFGICETGLFTDYRLDGLFGVTRPMLEVIVQINTLASWSSPPSDQEIESLKVKILLNEPRSLRHHDSHSTTSLSPSEHLIQHHAYVFHYACCIHYERTIRRSPLPDIQHLIVKSVHHIEAITGFEQVNRHASGIMWPAFIIICEVEDRDLRQRLVRYLSKGEQLGIRGLLLAQTVVNEVWCRRDRSSKGREGDIRWQDVMADLGLDLLLT